MVRVVRVCDNTCRVRGVFLSRIRVGFVASAVDCDGDRRIVAAVWIDARADIKRAHGRAIFTNCAYWRFIGGNRAANLFHLARNDLSCDPQWAAIHVESLSRRAG